MQQVPYMCAGAANYHATCSNSIALALQKSVGIRSAGWLVHDMLHSATAEFAASVLQWRATMAPEQQA